jgi:hypothetical protein
MGDLDQRFEMLFEDFEQQGGFSGELSDRQVVFEIYEDGELGAYEGWRILYERHPDDLRFLLLQVFQAAFMPDASTEWLARQLETLEAGLSAAERPILRTLVRRESVRHGDAMRDRLAPLRSRLAVPNHDDPDAIRAVVALDEQLGDYERKVIVELHDRTLGDKPLGSRQAQ